jgi:Uma2 family endonuclease
MTEQEYREFALGDPGGQWELVSGQLREKPGMSVGHGHVIVALTKQLLLQLDEDRYRIRIDHARLRVSPTTYYVPDIVVMPAELERAMLEDPRVVDAYPDPMLLVIEVWSPSTGDHDLKAKLADYQRRGDLEIWFFHPYDRTLTAWRRQPDGSYRETTYYGGIVRPDSVAGFELDLDTIFAS